MNMRRPLQGWLITALVTALLIPAVLVARDASAADMTLAMHGALKTTGGGPVANGKYILFVKVYADKNATKPVWSDVLKGIDVSAGYFSSLLGAGAKKVADSHREPVGDKVGESENHHNSG